MRKNIYGKKIKYITGGVTAMAMSVAACAAGVEARSVQEAGAGGRYDAGAVLNETETAASATDAETDVEETDSISEDELVDKLTSSVDVTEKDIYKDETVYAFADPTGKTTSILVNEVLNNTDNSATLTDKTDLTDIENVKGDETFTVDGDTITWEANGNDITYQGKSTKELPVNVAVSYYLDGKEVKPEEIAGKSGKVKIRFDYTNNETVVKDINGRDEDINVPFVAVTGMVLDDNFSNVTVTNGRSVSQGDSSIVIGFGMPGLLDSIKASNDDFTEDVNIPDYFEVEADVTDFSLDMTATVVVDGSAMNISGELDMSSLDDLMTSLSDATAQLVDGSSELSDGVATLLEKMGEFDTGVGTLKAGIDTLASQSATLVEGIGTIDASAQSISSAISTLDTALNTPMTEETKQATYNTAYNTASTAASAAAETTVGEQMAAGGEQYEAIKSQASTQFSSMLTSEEAQNAAVTQVSAAMTSENPLIAEAIETVASALQPQIYEALLSAYTSGAYTGAQQGIGAVAQQMQLPVDEVTIGGVASQVQSAVEVNEEVVAALDASATQMATAIAQGVVPQVASSVATSTTTSVMNTIAANYSDTVGISVADACQTAAVTAASQAAGVAAGQAAGQAAIQGAETAKSQIAAQIEATQANGYSLVTGAQALATGTSAMENATPALTDGIAALKEGAATLADGSSQLVDGVSALNDGALTLKDGIQTYDTEAISKIVNSYNGDIKSLVERLSAVASASSEYDTFTMHEDGVGATTKFIIKTAGIEATE